MFACSRCATIVTSLDRNKVCQQCYIGNANPATWAFEKLRKDLYQKIDDNRDKGRWHTEVSEYLHYHIDTGLCVANKRYSLEEAKKIVVISIVINCTADTTSKSISDIRLHFNRWTNDGTVTFRNHEPKAVQIKDINYLVEEGVPHFLEALYDLIKHARTGSYLCSTCEKPIKTDYLRHFAGVYCDACWKRHQKENSGTCGLCHKPYYECCC